MKIQSNSSSSHSPQSTSTTTPNGTLSTNGSSTSSGITQKRLHVSNIPFRFRDDDLKAMFEVSLTIKQRMNILIYLFCF